MKSSPPGKTHGRMGTKSQCDLIKGAVIMQKQTPRCCPYCTCPTVSKTKEQGMMEVGALEFLQDESEEDYPVDIWVCSECKRRFVILDDPPEESE
jgi:hypothetical protein